MITYLTRYSDTEKPDHMGRWARIATVNDIQIAWINRLEIKGDVRYSAGCDFPTRKHTDTPKEHKLFTDFESAKQYVAERWEWFKANMASG